MSAFTVNLEHVNVLVHAGMGPGADRDRVRWETDAPLDAPGVQANPFGPNYRTAVRDAAGAIGQMLLSENRRSVNYRYQEDGLEPVYTYTAPRKIDREPVEILKAIQCLDYQSCEHPEWAGSEARRYLDALTHRQIARLPGMSDAAWEIGYQTRTLAEQREAAYRARMTADHS